MKKVLILAALAAVAFGCAKEQTEKVSGKTQQKYYITAGIKGVDTPRSGVEAPSVEGVFTEGAWLAGDSRLDFDNNDLSLKWTTDDAIRICVQKTSTPTGTVSHFGKYVALQGGSATATFEGTEITADNFSGPKIPFNFTDSTYFAYYWPESTTNNRVGPGAKLVFYTEQVQPAPNDYSAVGGYTFLTSGPLTSQAEVDNMQFSTPHSLLEFNVKTSSNETDLLLTKIEFVSPGLSQMYSGKAGPAGGTATAYTKSIAVICSDSATAMSATEAKYWLTVPFVAENIDANTVFTIRVWTLKGAAPAAGNPDTRVSSARTFKVKKNDTGFEAGKRYYTSVDWAAGAAYTPPTPFKVAWRVGNTANPSYAGESIPIVSPSLFLINGLASDAIVTHPTKTATYPVWTVGNQTYAWGGSTTTPYPVCTTDAEVAATDAYIYFVLKPDAGKNMVINEIGCSTQSPGPGPKGFDVCYKIDAAAAFTHAGRSTLGNTTGGYNVIPLDDAITVPAGSQVTIKLVNYHTTSNTGNFFFKNGSTVDTANNYYAIAVKGDSGVE